MNFNDWNYICRFAEKLKGVPCLLAGGAVRNVVTDRPIRDIDIFVTQGSVDLVGQRLGITSLKCEIDNEEDYDEDSAVLAVYKDAAGLFDLIVVDDPRAQIDCFPDNLSQMWVNVRPNGICDLDWTPAARTAYKNKVIICDNITEKRLKRLQDLYKLPTWSFKINSMREKRKEEGLEGFVVLGEVKPRRADDHAPFYWEGLASPDSPWDWEEQSTRAMEATRALCKGGGGYRDPLA